MIYKKTLKILILFFYLPLQGMEQKKIQLPQPFANKVSFFTAFAKNSGQIATLPKSQYKIRIFEEPKPLMIWQMPNVLQQQDPASCGLHSLKNAILIVKKLPYCTKSLKEKIVKASSQDLRTHLNYEHYFLKTILPRFKPTALCFRQKIALQEYIQKKLEPCLLNTINEIYRKTMIDGSSAIAQQALEELKEKNVYELATTNVITLLHLSMPKELQSAYPIERLLKAFDIPKEDIVINHEIVQKAFYDKYLLPILKKYKIELTEKQVNSSSTTTGGGFNYPLEGGRFSLRLLPCATRL